MLELDATDHPTDLPEGFDSYLQGEFPQHGQKWEGCSHLYFPVYSRSHWYAVEVDISKLTMFIYDPNKSCSTDDQIIADLKPMTTILPMLLKKINIVIDALAIEWITTTSKQSNSGDFGVYAIKYIEFLSIGRKTELVNRFHMPKWRRKLVVELYTLDCTP
ncbi:Ubiquitin-like protease domain-containing protein [Abeliophyllum distichum]|uniref:Ubiquitin-like protease domain-containing protein n=1 Tax=Abeliophyllum distichum TaxID=126358 RepID=A0ABD1VZ68_9LAMI